MSVAPAPSAQLHGRLHLGRGSCRERNKRRSLAADMRCCAAKKSSTAQASRAVQTAGGTFLWSAAVRGAQQGLGLVLCLHCDQRVGVWARARRAAGKFLYKSCMPLPSDNHLFAPGGSGQASGRRGAPRGRPPRQARCDWPERPRWAMPTGCRRRAWRGAAELAQDKRAAVQLLPQPGQLARVRRKVCLSPAPSPAHLGAKGRHQ